MARPHPAGFGISRVLGSASSLRHTANWCGGRSPCTTELRRGKNLDAGCDGNGEGGYEGPRCFAPVHLWMQLSFRPVAFPQLSAQCPNSVRSAAAQRPKIVRPVSAEHPNGICPASVRGPDTVRPASNYLTDVRT